MSSFFLSALLAMAMAPVQAPATQTASTAADSPTAAHKDVAPAPATPAADLASSDPVITIHGLCSGAASGKGKSSDCTTVVTKQQFDAVVSSLNSLGAPLLPMQRRVVAEGYASTLLNYEAAKKAGVERDPRFAEVMRLARMRAMGDMYRALELEKAQKVSPQQIQAYYKNNTDKFEELTLRRVTLPRFNQANLKDEAFAAKALKLANEIHDRMVKGEDLDKLQKEAFDALGLRDAPGTKMGPVRRGLYAPDQEKQLFALKPGEVTEVIQQASAIIIFKLEGRETPSLEKSKNEIAQILTKQNLEKQEQARSKSIHVDYNERYVGPAQASGWMPANQLSGTDGHGANDPKSSAHKSDRPK
jgi:PPIC-type PPIASE domain